MTLLSRIKSMISGVYAVPDAPAGPACDIELTDDGFKHGDRMLHWATVIRIRTYKLDLVTIDCICLEFELDGEPPLEVTEESNGFNDLMDELLVAFPAIPADWYAAVMQPAFERNETLLFERAPR
jgi:hypothetical protein